MALGFGPLTSDDVLSNFLGQILDVWDSSLTEVVKWVPGAASIGGP